MNTFVHRAIIFALFAMLSAFSVFAQSNDEYNHFEGFVGYSYNNVDTGIKSQDLEEFPELAGDFDKRVNTNGLNASFVQNLHKYIGAKFDYSYHQKTDDFSIEGFDFSTRYRVHQFLGGLQFKNNLKDGPRFKPFGHVLAGVARQKIDFTVPSEFEIDPADLSGGETDFAMVLGGGVDIKVSRHVDVRAIQVDYNPIFGRGATIDGERFDGRTQNNLRLSFGIVFH
ncbi:MAG TPA: outer membrane beta-barrel protein [Pyrinomonadaceae bacterium]|jgi:opacity protein-like surface antigen|nr:outer membrane beta-barrel protein [Pyrinomonadaceae bacterium]